MVVGDDQVIGSVMLWRMSDARLTLLSTILSLPDDQRPRVERELVPLARAAALGELAADVAHDVANPLFGVLGLVDLLLEDAAPARRTRIACGSCARRRSR